MPAEMLANRCDVWKPLLEAGVASVKRHFDVPEACVIFVTRTKPGDDRNQRPVSKDQGAFGVIGKS
jgi:hypothetical protein